MQIFYQKLLFATDHTKSFLPRQAGCCTGQDVSDHALTLGAIFFDQQPIQVTDVSSHHKQSPLRIPAFCPV